MRAASQLSLALLLSALGTTLSACGGAPKPEPQVEAKAPPPPPPAPKPARPQGPDCSDGTCFACGQGFCPKGSYCDAKAPQGASCAWLPSCAGEPSCACLSQKLACACSESSGGPVLTCE